MEIILLIALTLLVIALARPRKPLDSRMIRGQGVDIILALDMSGSMACFDREKSMSRSAFIAGIRDGSVNNRLENAKNEIRSFIEARPNDRIGLIGFADLAYSFVPPTLDHPLLLERLKTLSPGELGESTGIASPIGSGVKHLEKSSSPRRVLVLFTDGANTAVNMVSPVDAAKAAKEFNVIIHTVGIGSDESYGIDAFNRIVPVDSMPDIRLLQDIAGTTGGNFYTAADAAGMKEVMERINELEKTDHNLPQPAAYREYAPVLVLVALGVLLAGFLMQMVMKVRLP